jgi:eukaryotic-like serine/threonine-protein kinase
MSPEQVRGKPVDGRTDLFALGICMYEMLAGEVPFKGESTMDVLMAIARDAHRPVRERNADVPEALAAVVDRCLAKSPDDRYASAREVVEALEAIAISADARVPQVRSEASTKSLGATAVSENRPRGSRWVVVGLGALLVGALALGLAWRARSSPSLTGPAASAASSGAGLDAELGIGLTELPPPRTSSPEAAKEYALAAQSVNDGSFDTGRVHLVRALKLDPGFAAAHLALVFWLPNKLDDDRRHVAAAAEGRAQLSDRDATVLEVFQQLLTKGTGSMDRTSEEAWQRWTSAAARFPTDAFILQTQATAGLYSGHEAEALKILDLSRKLDPKSVWPDLDVAMYLVSSGDLEGGMAAAARCLEISPSASICHTVRAGIELRLGQCGKLEEDARAAIALEPDASNAYYYLAGALLSKGASPESVVEANRRAEERLPDAQRKALFELTDANDMASLSGDFVTALAIFPRFDQLTATLPSGQIARAVFRAESDVLFETAQTDALLALADRYVKRLPVLTTDGPLTGKEIALWVRRRSGRIPDPEFRTLQEAWAKEARDAMPPKLANAVWFDFFAEPASSPKDAQEALDALARYSPLPAYEGMVPRESAMGQVLLLAGRVDEAIPHLRRAISACLVQDYIWQHQRAAELLGEALEAKRDKEGACTAYAEVLVHWGNAKPRSVTADKARARAKSLGCAK